MNASGGPGWESMGTWTIQIQPDFFVMGLRPAVYMAPGGSATGNILVGALGGFNSAVNLTASVSPSGVLTTSFAPTPVTGSGSSALTVSAPSGAAAGNY